MGFRSGMLAGQSSTVISWSAKHLEVVLSLWAGAKVLLEKEISISIKLVRRWKHKVLQNLLVDGCIDFGLDKTQWTNWATVQFFFSLAQVRCFWRYFFFRSGLVALFLKTSEHGDSLCTDSSFSPLLVKLSQVFESALLASIHLPSLWRASMFVFWIIAKSAVFPIIVVSKNKRYPAFILYGWSFNETQM